MNPDAYAITQAQLEAASVREPLTDAQVDWLWLCGALLAAAIWTAVTGGLE